MKKTRTKSILCLGMPNAGKTVYLTMLYHSWKKDPDFRVMLSPDSNADYLYSLVDKIVYQHQFPEPTTPGGFTPISLEIHPKDLSVGPPTQIKTFDYSGDSMVTIVEHFDRYMEQILEPKKTHWSSWFESLVAFMKKMDGVLVLIAPSSSKVKLIKRDEQKRHLFRLIYAILKGRSIQDGRPVNIPMAVTVTKNDIFQDREDDPWEFLEDNFPLSLEYARKSFRSVKYFSCSAVGPVVTKPREVTEPQFDGSEMTKVVEASLPPDPPQPEGLQFPMKWLLGYRL